MADAASNYDKNLSILVALTDALLRGEYSKIETADINAEGLLSTLAQKINAVVVNMKNVETPLSSAGRHAPNVVDFAQDVVQLMRNTANDVLNKADRLMVLGSEMETSLSQIEADKGMDVANLKKTHTAMQEAVFDIIATQSFQDVARQKMEVVIKDLTSIRDWLVEALVVLNLRKDDSLENVQKKAEFLREVSESPTEKVKQDLVDDLLAEFGF